MAPRIQKLIAESGICSRRRAEDLIKSGKVKVNNKIAKLGDNANYNDTIFVNNRKINIDQKLYLAFYKPRNVMTTLSDPQGRKTIKHYLKSLPIRVYPVGRLDYDAEGLLLLTNDGEFANKMMHPRYEKEKTYIAELDSEVTDSTLEKFKGTIKLKDGKVTIHSAKRIKPAVIELVIHEGRNKIVKRIFKKLGFNVVKLKRTQIGKIKIGSLKSGEWREIN